MCFREDLENTPLFVLQLLHQTIFSNCGTILTWTRWQCYNINWRNNFQMYFMSKPKRKVTNSRLKKFIKPQCESKKRCQAARRTGIYLAIIKNVIYSTNYISWLIVQKTPKHSELVLFDLKNDIEGSVWRQKVLQNQPTPLIIRFPGCFA